MIDGLYDDTLNLLERSLDLRQARHTVIASNVANAETPGYRALDLNFLDVLRETARRQQMARMGFEPAEGEDEDSAPGVPSLVADDTMSMGNDNNTVSVERELGKLSENELMFRVQMEILGKKMKMLREAVTRTP